MTSDTTWRERALEHLQSKDPRLVGLALPMAQRALALTPDNPAAHMLVARCHHLLGQQGEAEGALDRALELDPDSVRVGLQRAVLQLPTILRSEDDAARGVHRFDEMLTELVEAVDLSDPDVAEDAMKAVGTSYPFYLSYYTDDLRPLQERYGTFVTRAMTAARPAWSKPLRREPPPAGEPIDLGIPFGLFRSHSNWWVNVKGFLAEHDPARIRITGYHLDDGEDDETDFARRHCEAFVDEPKSFDEWAEAIAGAGHHALLYPEIKTNGVARRLAGLRLAPVQIATWGQPYTTGLPTIDHFLSSDLAEPPDAARDYTERLVRLPGLGIRYLPRPAPEPEPLPRSHFGLDPADTVYLCTQSLWKYRPGDDGVFPRIAAEVPTARFVFLEHRRSKAATLVFTNRLKAAFTAAGLDAEAHVVVTERLSDHEYASLGAAGDVFLDTPDWNGMASTLEWLHTGTPIVTTRGSRFRGRVGTAILESLGLGDLVAEGRDDYVATAIRLGRDPAWRDEVRRAIAGHHHDGYGASGVVEAFTQSIESAVTAP